LVNVTYSLEGSNGDVITFDESEYVLKTGILGFGIPPTSVRIEESAGDGGVWRHTKRLARDLDLPITVFGTDRGDVQTKLRRLGTLLQDAEGAPRLRATYYDGTSVFINVHYTGGGETNYDNVESGLTWATWAISLRAPNPFWLSGISEGFSISTGGTGRGLLPQLSKMKVSSSSTLGVVTVINAGDVATFPVWVISGPVKDVVITNGVQAFSFADVFSGEVITINTETASVTNADGDNLYARLNPAPKLFTLPPGTTGINVVGTDTDQNFNIQLSYSPRYEVIH
jgi:hypothetical protein|tara:strand:- start:1116 stop:1970 length:855 start_codon:yes stop_codon:yes gene_type:complete